MKIFMSHGGAADLHMSPITLCRHDSGGVLNVHVMAFIRQSIRTPIHEDRMYSLCVIMCIAVNIHM